jgi:hypothetical protein
MSQDQGAVRLAAGGDSLRPGDGALGNSALLRGKQGRLAREANGAGGVCVRRKRAVRCGAGPKTDGV